MKLRFAFSLLLLAATVACQKEAAPESPAIIKARVDSMIQSLLPEVWKNAAEDLDKRGPIEIKAKTDSIVNAKIKALAGDTVRKTGRTDTSAAGINRLRELRLEKRKQLLSTIPH